MIQTEGLLGLLPLTLVRVQCFQMPKVSEPMNEEKREGTMGSPSSLLLPPE